MPLKKAVRTLTKMIQQGQTIGIIGGGQLGQMMALDAKQTGMKVIILDPTPHCPAGQVADDQIVAPYADVKAIEELARRSDVLTYEFENVDLHALEDVADKVYVPQGTHLLYTTKNRIREKTFLRNAGLRRRHSWLSITELTLKTRWPRLVFHPFSRPVKVVMMVMVRKSCIRQRTWISVMGFYRRRTPSWKAGCHFN